MKYRVNEIFYSLQGEGYYTGTPAVFLRFSGCNPLFEMLTGRLPFEADSPVGVAIKQIEARALRPQEINPAIPDGLEDITVKAMCKDPDRRYQTAGEMLRDLEQFIQNPNVYFGYTELETAMERGSDVQRFLDDNSGPPRRGSREERGGRGGKNAASRRRYQEEGLQAEGEEPFGVSVEDVVQGGQGLEGEGHRDALAYLGLAPGAVENSLPQVKAGGLRGGDPAYCAAVNQRLIARQRQRLPLKGRLD